MSQLDDTIPQPDPGADPDRTAAPPPGPPLVRRWSAGQRFGAYVIDEEIGQGGQGLVLRARHAELGTRVAIKVLLDRAPNAVTRFQQEAQILARLEHQNLLRVSDLGTTQGMAFLAMEFVEGEDLRSIVERDGVPAPEWTIDVLSTVAHVLQYCHDHGLVHRDIKPANILIERQSGRPILVDFGLVKRDPERFALPSAAGEVVSDEEMMGTPAYMAPEQADPSFGDVGVASDVYGLGATLYYLLTGGAPYSGATAWNIISQLLQRPPPDPRTRKADVRADLAEVCNWSLAQDPAARPPTAAAFAQALHEGVRRQQRRRAQVLLALVALALGVALGVGGYALTRPVITWPDALRLVRAGGVLTSDELAALDDLARGGAPWARWAPFLRAQSAITEEREERAQLIGRLPAGPERDLLQADSLLLGLTPGEARRAFALLERGARAELVWRADTPAARWQRMAERLDEIGAHRLAARACLRVAALRDRPGEEMAVQRWIERAFRLDTYTAAAAGAPVARFLLRTASDALRESAAAGDAVRVRQARWQLLAYRLIETDAPLPRAVLKDLKRIGSHRDYRLRIAALRGSARLKPEDRQVMWPLLERPAIDTHPDGEWAYLVHGVCQDRPFAHDVMWEWLLWHPEMNDLWWRLGTQAWTANGRLRLARRAYEVVLARAPDHTDVTYSMGRMRHFQGRYAEALPFLRRAGALAKRNSYRWAWARYQEADCLMRLGRFAQAAVVWRELEPTWWRSKALYWDRRALAHEMAEQADEARRSATRAAALTQAELRKKRAQRRRR